MAKSASPIRLQEDLMKLAMVTGKRYHRSTAEQIEYWAAMGRNVSAMLTPDDLLSVAAGLATIKVAPVYSKPVDPSEVFRGLEDQRSTYKTLPRAVTSSLVKYQVSLTHPGYLEQIDSSGEVKTGKFQDGEFVEINILKS